MTHQDEAAPDGDVPVPRPSAARSTRGGWRFAGLAASVLAIGTYGAWRLRDVPAPAPARIAPVPVTVVRAARRDLSIGRSGLGTVLPLNQVDVRVRADGTLRTIAFAEGQEVKAGDLLAEIDPRPYQAALDQAKALLQKDMAQLASSRVEEARTAKLTLAGAGTSQAADNAKAQVAINQGTVAGDRAAVDMAALNLGFTRITAPIAGRVGLRQVNEGAVVRANDATGVVTVTQMRPIAVQFSLPQDELPDLLAGQSRARLTVSVDKRDGSAHLADGRLVVIDSQVDATTGMVRLKAEFDNDDLALWPGQLVTAGVVTRIDRNVLTLPAAAIQNGQNGPYVFVVRPDGTAAVSRVKTGPTVDGVTGIAGGVALDDDVVLSGQSRLATGTRVVARQADEAPRTVADGER